MSLTYEDVQKILRIIDQSDANELQLELDDFRLVVRRGEKGQAVVTDSDVQAPKPAAAPSAAGPAEPASAAASAASGRKAPSSTARPVVSPAAGTFYRAPAPGEAPFVEQGSTIRENDTVCILDVMKVMNHLSPPCAGTVAQICVDDGQAVAAGEVLMWIEPDA